MRRPDWERAALTLFCCAVWLRVPASGDSLLRWALVIHTLIIYYLVKEILKARASKGRGVTNVSFSGVNGQGLTAEQIGREVARMIDRQSSTRSGDNKFSA